MIIEGTIKEGDSIDSRDAEVGKVLIDKNYPFAVIKFTNNEFNFNSIYKTNNSKIKILKPDWIDKADKNI